MSEFDLEKLLKNPNAFMAFEDEVVLLDWYESAKGGQVVKLLIGPEYDAHPFKRFHIPGDMAKGTRFFMRMIELGDDDVPINQEIKAKVKELMEARQGAGHRVSKESAMMCGYPMFQQYVCDQIFSDDEGARKALREKLPIALGQHLKRGPRAFDDPKLAGEICCYYIYALCNIKSRAELDHHPRKALRFSNLIKQPYTTWRLNRDQKRSDESTKRVIRNPDDGTVETENR